MSMKLSTYIVSFMFIGSGVLGFRVVCLHSENILIWYCFLYYNSREDTESCIVHSVLMFNCEFHCYWNILKLNLFTCIIMTGFKLISNHELRGEFQVRKWLSMLYSLGSAKINNKNDQYCTKGKLVQLVWSNVEMQIVFSASISSLLFEVKISLSFTLRWHRFCFI